MSLQKKIILGIIIMPTALLSMTPPKKRGRDIGSNSEPVRVVRQRLENPPTEALAVTEEASKTISDEQETIILAELLKKDSDSSTDTIRLSPLLTASFDGDIDKVNKLVKLDTDINQIDDKGKTALHWAIMGDQSTDENKLEIIKTLLENKANINIKDNDGLTPLALAADEGYENIVKLLIDSKASLNTQDNNLSKLLNIPVNEWLLNNKLSIPEKNTGYTPLMRAIIKNNENIVKLLLDAGAKIYTKAIILDKDKKPVFITAFDLAKKSSDEDIQKLLDQASIKLEPLNKLLLQESKSGDISEVQRLIDSGANVDVTDKYGWTPLHYASLCGYKDIVKLLIDSDANVNVLSDVALAKTDADNHGDTPIHYASKNGHKDIIKLLIDSGANVNAAGICGRRPIHWASRHGKDIVKLLIDSGANIDATDNNGHTPIYWASKYGRKDEAKLLIDSGANVNTAGGSDNGYAPIHYVSRYGYKDIVKLLIDSGANINVTDNNGDTPISLASYAGHKDILEMLKKVLVKQIGENVHSATSLPLGVTSIIGECIAGELPKSLDN